MDPWTLAATGAGSATEGLGGLAGWVADVISTLGALGVGLLTLLEVVFPPIPSEVVLPFAGYLAADGRLSVVWAFVAATVGSVLGACILYWLGAALGRQRVSRLFAKVPLLDDDDFSRSEEWFDRHGDVTVLVGRVVPGVRSLVSLPAGIENMPFWRFLALTVAGTAVWNGLLVGAGYALGRSWRNLSEWSNWLNYAIYAAILLAVARLVWHRRDRISAALQRARDG